MSSVNVETEQPIASPATLPAAGAAGADGLLTTIIEEIQWTGRPVTHKLILAVLLERLETEHDPQMQDRYREALNSFMHTSVMDDICPLALACAVAGRAAQCPCCGTGQAPQGFDAALAGADAERRRLVTLLLRGPARIILAALFCGACFIRL